MSWLNRKRDDGRKGKRAKDPCGQERYVREKFFFILKVGSDLFLIDFNRFVAMRNSS